MYTAEEFDSQKTRVMKYIVFKKRTENEVRQKFQSSIEENMLEDIIEYLKEAKYINDYEYIEKQINEYMLLKTLSIKEIKYKLFSKGLDKNLIDDYINKHYEELKEYEQACLEKIKIKKMGTMDELKLKQYLIKKGYRGEY
ncbi:MAG: RecX family transcriptional regulator [Clostridia bacterium]|nr:RecX family transcriptional regulator [Clostridia bacterium]